MFSVKDYDLLGYNNQYIGEAFVNFKDIIETSDDICSLPQIHLPLSRPTQLGEFMWSKMQKIGRSVNYFASLNVRIFMIKPRSRIYSCAYILKPIYFKHMAINNGHRNIQI